MKGEGDQGSRGTGLRIEGRSASGVEGWSRGGGGGGPYTFHRV